MRQWSAGSWNAARSPRRGLDKKKVKDDRDRGTAGGGPAGGGPTGGEPAMGGPAGGEPAGGGPAGGGPAGGEPTGDEPDMTTHVICYYAEWDREFGAHELSDMEYFCSAGGLSPALWVPNILACGHPA